MTTLLSLWLRLTGGEQGCPRGRFALTMLAAYSTYHLLLPRFMHCAATLHQHALPADFGSVGNLLALLAGIGGMLAALVSLLLAFLPLSPLALLGFEENFHRGYELLLGATPSASPAPAELWPFWCGFLFSAAALLLAGSVAFGAAWRRLLNAGRSPLFLLLGLTYVLGFDSTSGYSAEAAGIYLLGPLWLIILYSQPGKPGAGFTIFRPLP